MRPRSIAPLALTLTALLGCGAPAADDPLPAPDTPDGGVVAPAPLRAFYTRIDSGEPWESREFVGRYPDVVVGFSETERLRFWRGSSFRPGWQTAHGVTYVEQLFAPSGDGDGLRFDRLNRHAHVRIIRQSPSEVVVHRRYAPVFDTGPEPMTPGWTGWIDEYYTVGADRRLTRAVDHHDAGERLTYAITLGADGTLTESLTDRGPIVAGPLADNPADRLPTGPDRDFGAAYARLGYAGPWDRGPDDDYAPPAEGWNDNWQVGDHPDVVVNFDGDSTRWVFWRGLSYVPSMVSEGGAWFSNEFNETWGWPEMCEAGGAEPMNDKQARYSHVRIIENTPARVVVHWRYHPTGVCYSLIDAADGRGTASDFVFYIYPDGSSLSQNTLYSDQVNSWPDGFEFHEAMIMHGPGTLPADNIEIHDTVTVMDMDDGLWVFDGADGGINNDDEEPFVDGPVNITRINLRGAHDTYTIMPEGEDNIIAPYWDDDFQNSTPDGHFVSWDHWPVNQIRAFGRGSADNRYPSHTSLFHMYDGPAAAVGEDFQQRLFLTGLSDRDDTFVRALARSWLRPPAVRPTAGITAARYDATERAYRLQASAVDGGPLAFDLEGSAAQPIVNPALVIRGWGDERATVRIDGQPADVRQGVVYDTDGAPMLVVFAPVEAERPLRFEITRAGR